MFRRLFVACFTLKWVEITIDTMSIVPTVGTLIAELIVNDNDSRRCLHSNATLWMAALSTMRLLNIACHVGSLALHTAERRRVTLHRLRQHCSRHEAWFQVMNTPLPLNERIVRCMCTVGRVLFLCSLPALLSVERFAESFNDTDGCMLSTINMFVLNMLVLTVECLALVCIGAYLLFLTLGLWCTTVGDFDQSRLLPFAFGRSVDDRHGALSAIDARLVVQQVTQLYFFSAASAGLPSDTDVDLVDEFVDQCAICFTEYAQKDAIRRLPCRHEFHAACVDVWLERHDRRCPLCRQSIVDCVASTEAASTPASSGSV